jgi:hypothetical protein
MRLASVNMIPPVIASAWLTYLIRAWAWGRGKKGNESLPQGKRAADVWHADAGDGQQ